MNNKQIDEYSYRKGYMQALNNMIILYENTFLGKTILVGEVICKAKRFKEIFHDEEQERCNCPICSIQYNGNP